MSCVQVPLVLQQLVWEIIEELQESLFHFERGKEHALPSPRGAEQLLCCPLGMKAGVGHPV